MIFPDPFGIATVALAAVVVVLFTLVYLVFSLRYTHGRRGPRAAYTFTALLASLVVALVGVGEMATGAGSAVRGKGTQQRCIRNSAARYQIEQPAFTRPPFPSPPRVVIVPPRPPSLPTLPPIPTVPSFPRPQIVIETPLPIELNAGCADSGSTTGASAAHGGVLTFVALLVMAFHARGARRMLQQEEAMT